MFHPEYISPTQLFINDDLLLLFKLVEKHGGVLRFVGGAVRDAIAGYKRSDIDLVTDMSPSEFSDMCDDEGLRCVPIGVQFFTMGVIIHNNFFKVTALSSDDDSTQDEWKKDAAKRDLTINAVYADEKGNVFDYYNGISDLEKGVIKFIGKPINAIKFDNIRIMRFFRFCAMFGRKIDKNSLKCCIENKSLLHNVSQEKIKEELFKIILAPFAVRALDLVFKYGVLDFLITPPKDLSRLQKLINLSENLCIEKDIIRRLYILFDPTIHRAERLAKIFRLDKQQKEHLLSLCAAKLSFNNFQNELAINKSIYQYGKEICCDKFLCLSIDNDNIDEIKKIFNTINNTTIPPFPITGKDLLNIGADNKFIGLYLDALKKEWFDCGCILSKKELLEKYMELFQKNSSKTIC